MARGGARSVSGPPPDPDALRRERPSDQATWTTLPAEGRTGEPPGWPLIDVRPREWELWRDLWTRPQAVAWERLGQEIEVALFVRGLTEAERPRSGVEHQKIIRQYLDGLGLSVQGMLRNRWRIAPRGTDDAPSGTSTSGSGRRPDARSRLKAVSDDTGG